MALKFLAMMCSEPPAALAPLTQALFEGVGAQPGDRRTRPTSGQGVNSDWKMDAAECHQSVTK
jgi:hypothetical protein